MLGGHPVALAHLRCAVPGSAAGPALVEGDAEEELAGFSSGFFFASLSPPQPLSRSAIASVSPVTARGRSPRSGRDG